MTRPSRRPGGQLKSPPRTPTGAFFSLTLPLPPSVNRIQKRLGNSDPLVKEWRERCHGYVYEQGPLKQLKGPYIIEIVWPISRWNEEKGGRFDADNKVKPLSDYIESLGIIQNDKLCWRLEAGWGNVDHDCCLVEVWPKPKGTTK